MYGLVSGHSALHNLLWVLRNFQGLSISDAVAAQLWRRN